MKKKSLNISLPQLVATLSDAVDLVSPTLNNHHKQVAYISYHIANNLNMPGEKIADLITAALLHDVGALSLRSRLELLAFEEKNPYIHTINGYFLLEDLSFFKKAGEIIKHHHLPWGHGAGVEYKGDEVHLESHILYLADRISVSIRSDTEVLNQRDRILKKIERQAGTRFHPQYIEVFKSLSDIEAFWMDIVSTDIDERLGPIWKDFDKRLNLEELSKVTRVFARIIDFRSRFTSVHSSGVAAVAEAIAKDMGWSQDGVREIRIAGDLHDLGKLAIPNEILDKPGRLTAEEFNIMKTHTYHSYHLLKKIEGLEEINEYASFHHERLDGKGYPFQLKAKDLKEGSRILAVADVFTAITEDRPYREGMAPEKALKIIEDMAKGNKLDPDIVALVGDKYGVVDAIRKRAQSQAQEEYEEFEKRIQRALAYYGKDVANF